MVWVDPRVGLGWVGSGCVEILHFSMGWIWLGWVEYDKSRPTIFLMITQHTILRDRASKIQAGIKNWRFSTNVSLYFENGTRYGHSYNGRPLTADSFAVSCIELGWVGSIFLDLRWVGLRH